VRLPSRVRSDKPTVINSFARSEISIALPDKHGKLSEEESCEHQNIRKPRIRTMITSPAIYHLSGYIPSLNNPDPRKGIRILTFCRYKPKKI
jgi:hypothetical protein